MKSARKLLRVFVSLSFICLLAKAQTPQQTGVSGVPRLVGFSGKVLDAQGKPISSIAGVTFAIYKDQHEGAPLWLETQNVHADAKGNYNVQLGATKPDGLPSELFSSGEARWLGVQLSGQGEQSRVLLLSVPYALKAGDAETVGGLPPSAFMLAAPPVVAPSAASGSSTAPAGAQAPPPATVTGSGTANLVPLWTGTTTVGNSVLFQSGTGSTAKIGINTTTPASSLDVQGGATVRGLLNLPATGPATATVGKPSHSQDLVASAFSTSSTAAVNQTFQWKAEPVNNNTATPSATLNLLSGKVRRPRRRRA